MSLAIFRTNRCGSSILSSIASQLSVFKPLTVLRTFKPFRKANILSSKFGVKTNDWLMPPYPYGPRHTFHQADRGLYGGAQLQYGNKISKGRNKGKTRRRWYPNVRLETIRSEALQMDLTIRITASCMRTIRKCGGLDQYLLGEKPARIKELGVFGWRLRWKVLNSDKMKKQLAAERIRLGIQSSVNNTESFAEAWNTPEIRDELLQEQEKMWEALREKDERFMRHVEERWTPADKKEWEVERSVPLFEPPVKLTKEQLEEERDRKASFARDK